MRSIVFIFISLLFFQCGIDTTITSVTLEEQQELVEFRAMDASSKLTIGNDPEPGEKLLVCVTFVNKENQQPLAGQRVKFYHTNNEGEYEPTDASDETSARLSGAAVTNPLGRIYVATILPGDYGSSENNRHIHTQVYGAKPEAYDINFSQFTGVMGRNFIKGSDQFFLTELKRTPDGVLVCFLTMEIKNSN